MYSCVCLWGLRTHYHYISGRDSTFVLWRSVFTQQWRWPVAAPADRAAHRDRIYLSTRLWFSQSQNPSVCKTVRIKYHSQAQMTLTDLWKQAESRLGDREKETETSRTGFFFHPLYIWIPALFRPFALVRRSPALPQMCTWQTNRWRRSPLTPMITTVGNGRRAMVLPYCIHRHTEALCSSSAVRNPCGFY